MSKRFQIDRRELPYDAFVADPSWLGPEREEPDLKVTLVEAAPFPADLCGAAAAVCTNSTNYRSALKHALESGHTSVLEHAVFTFKVEGLSRAALAQLTRHRLASFDVQSQRYVKLDDYKLVIPASIKNSRYAGEAESSMRYLGVQNYRDCGSWNLFELFVSYASTKHNCSSAIFCNNSQCWKSGCYGK